MFKTFRKRVWSIVTVVFWLVITFFIFNLTRNPKLIDFIRNLGLAGPVVVIGLFALLAPTPITTEGLLIANGGLFGPWWGSLLNVICLLVSAMVEYIAGKILTQKTNFAEFKTKMPWGLGKLPLNSSKFLIIGKLLPWNGAKIVNVAAGADNVPVGKQIWTSVVTSIPAAILWAYGGNQLITLAKAIWEKVE